jgi:hypothetical protein
VTTPIRNDSSPTINQDRGLKTRAQEPGTSPSDPRSVQQGVDNGSTSPAAEPDVARAAHLFSNESEARLAGEGMYQDAEQVRSAVDRLKELMAADPTAAMAAFGRANSQQAAAVLGQAPAV